MGEAGDGDAAAAGQVPYPCARLETTEGQWAGEAVEREAFELASAYGGIVDVRCSADGAILVYCDAEGTAVAVARRLSGAPPPPPTREEEEGKDFFAAARGVSVV